MTLSIPRDELPHDETGFESIALDISDLLLHLSKNWPKNRKRYISPPLLKFPLIHLKMQRSDLFSFQHFFNGESPPNDYTHDEYLAVGILLSFFSSRFLSSLARHRPRGGESKIFPLTSSLPTALFACRELISKARNGDTLQERVKEIIKEDDYLHEDLKVIKERICGKRHTRIISVSDLDTVYQSFLDEKKDAALVLTLVHRAFHGAWKAFDHPGLLSANPQDIFMQYLYGKRSEKIASAIQKAIQEFPGISDRIMKTWERLYLGAPGAAT